MAERSERKRCGFGRHGVGKLCVVGSKAEGLGQFIYLLIHSKMGSSYLAFGQTAQECFNKHKHSAIVVSE